MKEVVRITSKYQNTIFEAEEEINGVFMVLTENFRLISKRDLETDPNFKDERPLRWIVSPANNKLEFEYETEPAPLPDKKEDEAAYYRAKIAYELNERKMRSVADFWSRHSRIQHLTPFGNGFNPTNEGFFIEIVTQKAKRAMTADIKKIQICNKVLAMSLSELVDLVLYYAPHLYGRRKSEMLQGLIGLKGIGTDESGLGGVLWQNDNADDFLLRYFDNPTVSMKVYVSKAQQLGIISKGVNGGLYLNGSIYCGEDIDAAVVFFTKDVQSYTNIVKPEVDRISQLPTDDMVDVKLDPKGSPMTKAFRSENRANNDKSGTTYSNDFRNLMREYEETCAKIGERHQEPITYENLKTEIVRVRAAYDAIKKRDESPTGQLMNMVDELATEDIDKLKEIGTSKGMKGIGHWKDADKLRAHIREFLAKAETVQN